ncbi:glycerate kinase [Lacticaseibacillus absianus]|uniref:glycerate kinase n=1 Tax=Lacticaseibacillus absianus TaxID=2729623 RepID=UPI0015CC9833
MKVVIAPDSFKGSLSAPDVAAAISRGVRQVLPALTPVCVPMADGGEGTVDALVTARQGQRVTCQVHSPYGPQTAASYGLLEGGQVAVIEVAAASGIQFMTPTSDVRLASSLGTGELIEDALARGAKTIIVGLGGSGTNDGGAGIAQALGVRFYDAQGQLLPLGGAALRHLATIDCTALDPRVGQATFILASDVTNPLVGPNGASAVFGPQKGATPAMVAELDEALAQYAAVVTATLGRPIAARPGAGAAGGCGAGLLAFTNATLRPGVEMVLNASHFESLAADADLVFTGEGALDFQTRFGKTPYGVAQAVRRVAPQATVVGLAGKVGDEIEALYAPVGPFDAIVAIASGAKTLEAAVRDTAADLTTTAANLTRLYLAGRARGATS